MATSYLSKDGTLYLWQKIKSYIASVTPTKQSDLTNDDYTVKDADYATYKSKVATLEGQVASLIVSGGEPNVLEGVQVNGADLTINQKKVNLTVASGTNNGSIAINGTDVAVTGLGSAAYTPSTAYDAAGAAATVLGSSTDTAGTATVYGNQASINAINNAGYQTASQVSSAIQSAIASVTQISYEVVANLPASGETGVIYLIANNGSNPNIYDEYIWYNNRFEKIGTTDVDLSNYLQTTDVLSITNAEIDTIVAS